MCESRATVLGSLMGDEEDFMKEINNSLTNSPCLVPWRLASVTLRISRMKESQESRFLWRHEKIMRSEIGRKIFWRGLWEVGTSDREAGRGAGGMVVIVSDFRQGRSQEGQVGSHTIRGTAEQKVGPGEMTQEAQVERRTDVRWCSPPTFLWSCLHVCLRERPTTMQSVSIRINSTEWKWTKRGTTSRKVLRHEIEL